MAAETAGFTDSNPIIDERYEQALHAELHECLRLMRKIDTELEAFRPLLRQFTSPVAIAGAVRRARKNGNG